MPAVTAGRRPDVFARVRGEHLRLWGPRLCALTGLLPTEATGLPGGGVELPAGCLPDVRAACQLTRLLLVDTTRTLGERTSR